LNEKGHDDVVIVDQNRLDETQLELSVSDHVSGNIRIGDKKYDIGAVSSAYLRPYSRAQGYDDKSDHILEIDETLTSWCEITSALVVNRFSAMASNSSKPYQASIIKKYGFNTPDTLISTTPQDIEEFCELYDDVIYKSISGVRSVVSRLSKEKMKDIKDVMWSPTQFQQYVSGIDIRVHVVDDKIICSEIITNADDYRYAKRTGDDVKISACDIPDDVGNKCIELVKELGLVVGGVDLRVTPDRQWYCFEVNPSPGFTYYQSHTGQDISGEIADMLIKGRCESLYTNPGSGRIVA
jgi:glutathione synthase/RimK-type ligase-like ATP-grasp enzyme